MAGDLTRPTLAPKVITDLHPGAQERKPMIRTEIIGSNVIRITAPDKLERADFEHLAPVADDLIKKFGTLRLLIDATSLKGWKNVAALQHHAAFVKSHQRKVDRIAVILAHDWQRWLVAAVKVFLHPEVRVYKENEESEALKWILNGS